MHVINDINVDLYKCDENSMRCIVYVNKQKICVYQNHYTKYVGVIGGSAKIKEQLVKQFEYNPSKNNSLSFFLPSIWDFCKFYCNVN
jgi:hypothetical protein